MPIYEYQCQSCYHEFEALVRGGDAAGCPSCGSARLEKQWSVPAAHSGSVSSLPICEAPRGGCGAPQCGQGGCGM